MKKIISRVVAMLMLVSMALPAFAVTLDGTTYEIPAFGYAKYSK
mgnify:CR=1 FL=1